MNLNEKLDAFLNDNNSHAFLLHGPWGVGKTYAIDCWLNSKPKDGYKIIKLSLFGISDINDLNSMALRAEGLKNKFKSYINGLSQDFSCGIGPVSIGLPLIGMVSSLLKEKHKDKNKYLFIIDDIERKDNDLSIEKILGFVDSLPFDNTKVILIANLDKLNDIKEFKGFKEKVIQTEYNLYQPTHNVINSIIGDQYSSIFIDNNYRIQNLRTLIQMKMILSNFEEEADFNLVKCIYYCLLNICENRFGIEDLKNNYKNNETDFFKYFLSMRNDDTYLKNVNKKVESYVSQFNSDVEYLYENIRLLNLLDMIRENDLKQFVFDVYNILISEDYERLNHINVPRRSTLLKEYEESTKSIFYSKNPNEKYFLIMKDFKQFFYSEEYDLLDLFIKFYSIVINCKDIISKSSNGKKMEKTIIKECPKLISSYIFNNLNMEADDVNLIFTMGKIPEWIISIENNIVLDYAEKFNNFYISKSQSEKINYNEINKRLDLIKCIFSSTNLFDEKLFDIDSIMLNAIKYMLGILKEELNDDDWSYCDSLIKWMKDNKSRFDLDRSIQFLNTHASKNNLSGYRLLVLVNRYELKK